MGCPLPECGRCYPIPCKGHYYSDESINHVCRREQRSTSAMLSAHQSICPPGLVSSGRKNIKIGQSFSLVAVRDSQPVSSTTGPTTSAVGHSRRCREVRRPSG